MNYFRFIRKRLRTLGVKPSVARVIALDFDKQVRSKGLAGALSYFKDVGDTLIGYISGSKYKAPWVSTKSGYPRKWLLLKDAPLEVQLRVAKMARAIYLSLPTAEQVEKLRVNAVSDYSGTAEALLTLSSLQRDGLEYWKLYIPEYKSRFGTVLRAGRSFVSKSVPSGPPIGFDLETVASTYKGWRGLIHDIPDWQDALYPVHTSWLNSPKCPVTAEDHDCGLIGGTMEQGGKLRMFASPSVLLQELLTPLQQWLDAMRIQVNTDVFKDQERGAIWAQKKLMAGIEVQSIDLSSATCRYPFVAQIELLEELGCPSEVLALYKAVARGKWKVVPKWVPYFGEYISWNVGQPLGTNPSMSSFALSHNLVLTGLCMRLGIDPEDSFRVLGDDVVCADSRLAHEYRLLITDCGIKISEHKSYASNGYAEFAGYSITPDVLVRPGKWKVAHELNTQGLIKELGEAVLTELEDQESQDIEAIIAFRHGSFTPKLEDYPYYLFMSSTLWDSTEFSVSLKDHESDWYDGCTKHLRILHPGIFFQPPTQDSFFHAVMRRLRPTIPDLWETMHQCIGPYDPDTWPPYQIATCYEAVLVERTKGVSELLNAIRILKEEYEAYLWSLPVTSTKKAKAQREVIRERRLALAG